MILIGVFQVGVDIAPYIPTADCDYFDFTNATDLASGIAGVTKSKAIAFAGSEKALRFIVAYSPSYILLIHNYPPVKVLTIKKMCHLQFKSQNFFDIKNNVSDLETEFTTILSTIESMEETIVEELEEKIQKKIDLRMYGEER